MRNKKIAIFFDCENVSADYVPSIFNELANYGEVIIKQSFKDWSSLNNKAWNQDLHQQFAIEPIQVFTSKNAKNSSDLRIQRAVIETMNQKNINIIVLVSSDSDFSDLAINIRSNNFESIGFGESKTPDALRNAYSIFIELPIKKEIKKDKDKEIINLLINAIKNTKEDKDYCLVSQIGTYLKNKNSSNNPKNFGANTWGDLIKKYPNDFKLSHLDKVKSTLIAKIK